MIDSFKYLPRLIARFYQSQEVERYPSIPWTPFRQPVRQARFAIITSAGLYIKNHQPPFDIQQEQAQPTWGDPSFRIIPSTTQPDSLAISHLHINPRYILEDINVVFPLQRLSRLATQEMIGHLAQRHYSVMGYQGFPPNLTHWKERTAPQIIRLLEEDEVQGVLLTPA